MSNVRKSRKVREKKDTKIKKRWTKKSDGEGEINRESEEEWIIKILRIALRHRKIRQKSRWHL